MIHYRSFRNTDPPGLVEVWNEALTGRGTVRLRHSSPLERFAFSKLFFDPAGLIVAEDAGRCVGFVHAGFGPNASETALDMQSGVTCLLAVVPSYRGRGIGTELLHRAENYLRAHGAQRLCAGPLAPLDPFYFGLYGGSDLAGFLDSDAAAEPFFTHRGYQVSQTVRILQRRLSVPIKVFDARFVKLKQRFELCEEAGSRLRSWWRYNRFNGAEPRVFALLDKNTNQYAAEATLWEMEGLSIRWNLPAAGVVDWSVVPGLRRQGIGKFFLTQLLRKAQEELLEVLELQVSSENQAAQKLAQGLGFEQVDLGRIYQRQE